FRFGSGHLGPAGGVLAAPFAGASCPVSGVLLIGQAGCLSSVAGRAVLMPLQPTPKHLMFAGLVFYGRYLKPIELSIIVARTLGLALAGVAPVAGRRSGRVGGGSAPQPFPGLHSSAAGPG